MKNSALRLPAEWEPDSDILMAWPHEQSDWNYMLHEIRSCYLHLIDSFISAGHRVLLLLPDLDEPLLDKYNPSQLIKIKYLTNDTWTRDYGPISLIGANSTPLALDFTFNGWGLKFAANRDNMLNSFLFDKKIIASLKNCQDFVLEGGGIESDGNGTLLTAAQTQFSPNRNNGLSHTQITEKLSALLHTDRILMISHGYLAGDDTDSHIDTLARFAPHNTIVFTGCDDPTDEHFTELNLMKEQLRSFRTAHGQPYNLIELPLPDPIYHDGERLPATYANFLATDKAIFLPIYGQPQKDLLAEQIIKIAFDKPVYTINCSALIRQHGSLHCATMQIPSQLVNL